MNGTSLTQLAQIIAGNENQAKISSDEDVDEIIRNLPHGSGMKGDNQCISSHLPFVTLLTNAYIQFLSCFRSQGVLEETTPSQILCHIYKV